MLQAVGYYLVLPLLYGLSYLPTRVLYAVSDVFCWLMYNVVGYRKQVVLENLRKSFPEKSEAELKAIMRGFYAYFCDLLLEIVKAFTISATELRQRFTFHNLQLLEQLQAEGKSIVLVTGHHGNWEWAGHSFVLHCNVPAYIIYKPLENTRFDGLIYRMRTRFGLKLIAMQNVYRDLLTLRGQPVLTAFIADQTPHPEFAYWTMFMNQDTPVFPGTEKVARKFSYPVVYASTRRLRRGYYQTSLELLAASPQELPDGAISELHTRRLEQDIRQQPEIWLWSHRRWKYTRPQKLAARLATDQTLAAQAQ